MNWILQMIMGVLGGLGIFLYGMYIASEGLKKSASNHIKKFLNKMTKNQFSGSIVGIVLAAIMQSSSAATVMVVGFVNAKLLALRQAMGVMLGTAIGTTITVQLIAFKLTDYALLFIALGVFIFLVTSSSSKSKSIGSILLGFGFVFYGMGIMTNVMLPLQTNPDFVNFFIYLSDNLLVTMVIALLFTAIIQNSAATIAIAMTLALNGSLTLEASIAIVYGANIGTVVTALISSINASRDAQRAAVAHAIFKAIGVLFFLPFTQLFAHTLQILGGDIERQIANAHTVFNIVNMVILLPFCNKFAEWMVKLLKNKEESKKHVKYIDKESLEIPTIALVQTKKELGNMARTIDENMLKRIEILLDSNSSSHSQSVIDWEKTIDEIYKETYHYLQKITKKDLSDEDSTESIKYLYINNELEGISDALQQIALTTMKLENTQAELEKWEIEGITQLYKEVVTSFHQMLQAFDEDDQSKAIETINRNPKILRTEKKLRYQHFNDGTNESSRLSSVYLDIMNELLRVNSHTVNISHTIIGMI